MGLFNLFRRNPHEAAARALYGAVVAQSRLPAFYEAYGVPDTPDGRFDMIAVHAFAVMRRLGGADNKAARDLSQTLFDVMFVDVDRNLREMGISDIRIGSNVKAVARAFYGRIDAYDAGLKAGDDGLLRGALSRNLFRKSSPSEAQVGHMAAYVRRLAADLDAWPLDDLMAGRVDFAAPRIPESPP